VRGGEGRTSTRQRRTKRFLRFLLLCEGVKGETATGREDLPKPAFKIGDRVRVRVGALTPYAGRTREVLWIDRPFGDGPSVSSVVRLDPDAANAALLTHAVFGAHDLEPEPATR